MTDAMAGGRRAGAVSWAARGVDGSRESPEVSQAMGDGCVLPSPDLSLSLSLWLFLPERAEVGVATLLSGGQQQSDLIQPPRPRKPPMRAVNAGVVTAQHNTAQRSAGAREGRGPEEEEEVDVGCCCRQRHRQWGLGRVGVAGAARLVSFDLTTEAGGAGSTIMSSPSLGLHVGDLSALN